MRIVCKVLFLMVVSVAMHTSQVFAQTNGWAEIQQVNTKENSVTRLAGGLAGSITDTIGYYTFGLVQSDGYYQVYGGPTWKPFSFLEVGVGIGMEDAKPSLRKNAYFQFTGEKVSAFGTFENGGSGPYHKVVLNYRVAEQWGVGLADEKFLGRGPRVEYMVQKDVTLWWMILRDRDTNTTNTILGATLSF